MEALEFGPADALGALEFGPADAFGALEFGPAEVLELVALPAVILLPALLVLPPTAERAYELTGDIFPPGEVAPELYGEDY